MRTPLRFGVTLWPQYTDWPGLLAAARRADDLGFDSVWTWDHMYPVIGSSRGPTFEGWMTLAAFAQATRSARVGLMVSANTFRAPTLVAKMATTLDHISGGRAILGIGAAWVGEEHEAFGFDFGTGPGERLRWLGEALPIIRGMLDGAEPVVEGRRYRVRAPRNLPPPVQPRLPILVAGVGERVTLRLVAQHADMCNFTGGLEAVRRLEPILQEHCRIVGRPSPEIERTSAPPVVIIRDVRAEARRVYEEIIAAQGGGSPRPLSEPTVRYDEPAPQPVGTADDVAWMITEFARLGHRHLIFTVPPPYDDETLVRLIREVRPMAYERLERVHAN